MTDQSTFYKLFHEIQSITQLGSLALTLDMRKLSIPVVKQLAQVTKLIKDGSRIQTHANMTSKSTDFLKIQYRIWGPAHSWNFVEVKNKFKQNSVYRRVYSLGPVFICLWAMNNFYIIGLLKRKRICNRVPYVAHRSLKYLLPDSLMFANL